MRLISTAIIIGLLFCFFLISPSQSKENIQTNEFLWGFSQKDITPTIGKKPVFVAGFGHNRIAKGVHDPLFVRAVVIQFKGKKVALACADLVGLFNQEIETIRKSLPNFNYVMVSSTHNHEGPDTLGLWGKTQLQSGLDPDYMEFVRKNIILAIKEAEQISTPGTAIIGQYLLPELLHDNRDPQIKLDTLTTLSIQDQGKKNLGTLVFWHCHPETLASSNQLISADFVGYAAKEIENKLGGKVILFTGAVGGLMTSLKVPIKNQKGEVLNDGTFEKTEEYGKRLAEGCFNSLKQGKLLELNHLDAKAQKIFLPVDNPFYRLLNQIGVFQRPQFEWDPISLKATGPKEGAKHPAIQTEIGMVQIGELSIACVPGEIYPELVLGKVAPVAEKEADFPDAPIEPAIFPSMKTKYQTMIGLANDEVGYILPKRQWDEKKPFTYGRKTAPYGEINSLGPETAKLICEAFQALIKN